MKNEKSRTLDLEVIYLTRYASALDIRKINPDVDPDYLEDLSIQKTQSEGIILHQTMRSYPLRFFIRELTNHIALNFLS